MRSVASGREPHEAVRMVVGHDLLKFGLFRRLQKGDRAEEFEPLVEKFELRSEAEKDLPHSPNRLH